jgi:hypothetical protein
MLELWEGSSGEEQEKEEVHGFGLVISSKSR